LERNAIYFPYIEVPRNSWFYRVLLYWNNVSTIIPLEYHNKSKIGPFMYELIEKKLIRPIYPDEMIKKIPKFDEEFINYISSEEYLKEKRLSINKKLKTRDLHFDKIESIKDKLIELDLAKKISSPWYEVEQFTAVRYMAYLASKIGNLPDVNSRPTTDDIKYLNGYASDSFLNGKIRSDIETTRGFLLKELFPSPVGNISPRDIIEFKDENNYELMKCQNKIESFLIDYISTDSEFRKEKYNQFIHDYNEEKDNIIKLMNKHGWEKINFGDFVTYFGLGGGFGASIARSDPAGAITSLSGIVGKSYSDYKKINNFENEKKQIIKNSYTAYAVLYEKEYLNI